MAPTSGNDDGNVDSTPTKTSSVQGAATRVNQWTDESRIHLLTLMLVASGKTGLSTAEWQWIAGQMPNRSWNGVRQEWPKIRDQIMKEHGWDEDTLNVLLNRPPAYRRK